jgi:hypothetical protein
MRTTVITTVGAGSSKIWCEEHYQIKTRPSQNAMKSSINQPPGIHLATDIDEILELGREYDYKFNGTELQAFLGKMPKKELASLMNPGIGNRLHLSPR